jgi:hypothetical protein
MTTPWPDRPKCKEDQTPGTATVEPSHQQVPEALFEIIVRGRDRSTLVSSPIPGPNCNNKAVQLIPDCQLIPDSWYLTPDMRQFLLLRPLLPTNIVGLRDCPNLGVTPRPTFLHCINNKM